MPNRLAQESSPYLQQHASNPVDWYPWGSEALARARAEQKPILLSIGYSSCHWCHVMEHESFSDAAIAEYMNEHFVSIKVDREDRPDIDAIYMEAVQAMTGHGGWPLTAFLTPDQVPFHMGTYFPPEPRPNMPSFHQVMEAVVDAWQVRRSDIESERGRVIEVLSGSARMGAADAKLAADTLSGAAAGLKNQFDADFGGFGGAPKFPVPMAIDFLLGHGDDVSRAMAIQTLRAMAAGGIYDQLGGGFSRYSVDERWHVPHFEKMLYDNALLARSYLHGFQSGGGDDLARVCREALDWMLAEMLGADGGFCSALDADSEGDNGKEEGFFYSWTIEEFRALCGDHADAMCGYFGVIDHGELDGRNVLHIAAPERRPTDEVFARVCADLLTARAQRERPFRDEKRITAWNALAVAALAEAGRVLCEQRYVQAAVAAAEFVETHMRCADGSLLRSWLDGRDGPQGFLEDHAYVVGAWLSLFEATGDDRWFVLARQTADQMIERFGDPQGGFFTTSSDAEKLLVRRKDLDDNPIPSGNSAAALGLLRLAALTGERSYRDSAAKTLSMLQPLAAKYPTGFANALQGIAFYLAPTREVALVGDDVQALLAVVDECYRPNLVVATTATASVEVPLLLQRTAADGRPTAYVCSGFSCQAPVSDADALRALLSE